MADNEYIKRSDVIGLIEDTHKRCNIIEEAIVFAYLRTMVMGLRSADVAPRAEIAMEIFAEIEEIFEKFKMRQRSNSVCAWCVHATDYGRRNEECDQPYVDKNGKEQKACYVYAKFESLIDKELAELKKKYTEEKK